MTPGAASLSLARWWHQRRPSRWPTPHFVQAPASASLAVRLALGASIAMVATSSVQAWSAWQTLEQDMAQQALASQRLEAVRQQRLARATAATLSTQPAATLLSDSSATLPAQPISAAQRTKAAPGFTPSNATAKSDAAQAQQHRAGMRSAWAHVLLPLEEAGSADVRWLGLDHVAGKGQLRISGLTSHLEPLLGAMQRLSVQPGWSDITLTQLQSPTSAVPVRATALAAPENPQALRFELQAQFDGTVFP